MYTIFVYITSVLVRKIVNYLSDDNRRRAASAWKLRTKFNNELAILLMAGGRLGGDSRWASAIILPTFNRFQAFCLRFHSMSNDRQTHIYLSAHTRYTNMPKISALLHDVLVCRYMSSDHIMYEEDYWYNIVSTGVLDDKILHYSVTGPYSIWIKHKLSRNNLNLVFCSLFLLSSITF